jgi:hypothetical protein
VNAERALFNLFDIPRIGKLCLRPAHGTSGGGAHRFPSFGIAARNASVLASRSEFFKKSS